LWRRSVQIALVAMNASIDLTLLGHCCMLHLIPNHLIIAAARKALLA